MLFLTELLSHYKGSVEILGNAEKLPISSITSDSRKAVPGCLFVAITGNEADGTIFAFDAIDKGAVAVIASSDSKLILPKSIVLVKVDNVRLALTKLAEAYYTPQPKFIAAVTGTDGKTSTVDFLRQLWQMNGHKATSIGTLGVIDPEGNCISPAVNTTPDPVLLHQTLQALAKGGCEHVAIEASSHGLHQYRLDGLHIKAAAFTNLTRDHLDYHQTLEAYFHSKLRLFLELLPTSGTAVLNADDPKYVRISELCKGRNVKVLSYGYNGEEFKIIKVTHLPEGLGVQASILGKSQHFMLNMYGEFQVANALTALGLYIGCGGKPEDALKHLPHLHNVRGRMERVAEHPNGAGIFVDYAHTPAALANVMSTLRKHIKGRLVVVFGCGGNRDKGKRAAMGKEADEFADEVIVTDDNPRNENPAAIRTDIMAGVPRAKNIADRAEAITYGIKSLGSQDVLLIAGKGHETTQIVGDKTLPFNDAEVARYAVKLCEQKQKAQ